MENRRTSMLSKILAGEPGTSCGRYRRSQTLSLLSVTEASTKYSGTLKKKYFHDGGLRWSRCLGFTTAISA
jgi:hypothetical protein